MAKRRRPILSIIVTVENNIQALERCLDSLFHLKKNTNNFELVIVNNYKDEFLSSQISYLINRYSDESLVFFQANHELNTAQLRNLGMAKSRGSWLYFMESTESITKGFVQFIYNFKFDLQNHFYRVPILISNNKKAKITLFKNKFYSVLSSSIIVNQEVIEKYKISWDPRAQTNDALLFLDQLYSIKNVNYVYLKKNYAIYHDIRDDINQISLLKIEDIMKIYNIFMKNKNRNYKQFIIILFYKYVLSLKAKNLLTQDLKSQIGSLLRKAKISFFSYLLLPRRIRYKAIKTLFFIF